YPVATPVSRPTPVDYLLVFFGCGLSLYMNQISGPRPEAKDTIPLWIQQDLLPHLPALLLLPQGIILLWPMFYGTQRLLGRRLPLSAGECLGGVAGLGTVLIPGWVLGPHRGTLPAFAENLDSPPQFLWTIIAGTAMAVTALLIGLV